MRLTIKNPDGRTYRLPMINKGHSLNLDMSMNYPTLTGSIVDIIGKIEDTLLKPGQSLEDWLKKNKK